MASITPLLNLSFIYGTVSSITLGLVIRSISYDLNNVEMFKNIYYIKDKIVKELYASDTSLTQININSDYYGGLDIGSYSIQDVYDSIHNSISIGESIRSGFKPDNDGSWKDLTIKSNNSEVKFKAIPSSVNMNINTNGGSNDVPHASFSITFKGYLV